MNLHWLERYSTMYSGVAASVDFVYWSSCSGMLVQCIYRQLWWTRAELYESGIDPLSFISKGGANILDWYWHWCEMNLSVVAVDVAVFVWFEDSVAVYGAMWCIDIVGENTINDLNLWLERVIVVPTMTWNMCNFVISWYCDIVVDMTVMICIFAILWFCDTQLWNCDDRNICMFGELWFWIDMVFTTMTSEQSTISWIWCCSWGTTTWES